MMRPPERPLPAEHLADVLWSRTDRLSLENCRVTRFAEFNSIQGCVLAVEGGAPYRVDYVVRCDPDWTTRAVFLRTIQGTANERLELERDDSGEWSRDGERLPGLDGLSDIDLAISPSTNTLPIRRLRLAIGSEAEVDAAWVRFPELTIERLPQRYIRTGERRYRYESAGGSFSTDLEVDAEGVVVWYGDLWKRVAPL